MLTAVRIPSDTSESPAVCELGQFRDLEQVLGGPVLMLELPIIGVALFASAGPGELPFNPRATLLSWFWVEPLRAQTMITGDVVLVGAKIADDRGALTHLPADLVGAFTGCGPFFIEVQEVPAAPWRRFGEPDATYFDALAAAIILGDVTVGWQIRVVWTDPDGQRAP